MDELRKEKIKVEVYKKQTENLKNIIKKNEEKMELLESKLKKKSRNVKSSPPFHCLYCKDKNITLEFNSIDDVVKHQDTYHSHEKRYGCTKCVLRFHAKNDMFRHMRLQHGFLNQKEKLSKDIKDVKSIHWSKIHKKNLNNHHKL